MKNNAQKIGAKQKRLFWAIAAGFIVVAGGLIFLMGDEEEKPVAVRVESKQFDVVSQEIDPQIVRLSSLEKNSDSLNEKLQSLETTLKELKEEKEIVQEENESLSSETQQLKEKMGFFEEMLQDLAMKKTADPIKKSQEKSLKAWERAAKKEDRHVLFEIPAGTVLKAVLVSGADCSVGVHKTTGANMMLLRPLDNGQLPRNVRVPLKGSVIIGNAVGDISSERVYVRAERMTLVEKNGNFVETEVSAYVSGEDGREGMRGVVVDRSGQIITRAAFASFLQGIGQGVSDLGNTLPYIKAEDGKTVLGVLSRSGSQGSATAFSKLSDYYIKRAEQLQPAIQIAAGRVVDVVFTKSVKIGEKDLKKKFQMERAAKKASHE